MRSKKAPLLAMVILFALTQTALATEIAIIVNTNSPLTRLSVGEIADIYLGQKEVAGNVRLKPVDQSDKQEINAAFLEKILHMTHDAYVTYWNRRLFQEGGIPPSLKGNSKEVISTVKEKEGAIGYVWASELNAEGIRAILTIDP